MYARAGSFGISACCSVDRDLVVLACRGQAMSLAFNEIHGVVLWGSEVCCSVLQCVAVRYSVLVSCGQAMCLIFNHWRFTKTFSGAQRYVAVCCSVLQCAC